MNSFYQQAYEKMLQQQANGDLRALQEEQFAEFIRRGFPTHAEEAWRYTDVSVLAAANFQPVSPSYSVNFSEIKSYLLPDCDNLVFINGYFAPHLSSVFSAESGVTLQPVKTIIAQMTALSPAYSAFDCLNLALLTDGLFLSIAPKVRLQKPVQILHCMTDRVNQMQNVRHIIKLSQDAEASIFENYITLGGGKYFTNSVMQIDLSDGAQLNYAKNQEESSLAYHIAATHITQQSHSIVRAAHFSLGSQLGREELYIEQLGQAAVTELFGLGLLNQQQHVDQLVRIKHSAAHGSSQQLYKNILAGNSTAVFDGRIIVEKQAKAVSAQQTNKNLLLTKTAIANSKPALEIYADDVKCTHGATVGQIEASTLFYLRSRGLDKNAATMLLMQAFISDVFEKMPKTLKKNFPRHQQWLTKLIAERTE